MREISTDAELSQTYTNHCIRATYVTILDKCGFEARHIMSISGHRSESIIWSYARTDVNTKRNMSKELAKFCESEKTFDFGIEIQTENPRQPLSVSNNHQELSSTGLSYILGNATNRSVQFNNCNFYLVKAELVFVT